MEELIIYCKIECHYQTTFYAWANLLSHWYESLIPIPVPPTAQLLFAFTYQSRITQYVTNQRVMELEGCAPVQAVLVSFDQLIPTHT